MSLSAELQQKGKWKKLNSEVANRLAKDIKIFNLVKDVMDSDNGISYGAKRLFCRHFMEQKGYSVAILMENWVKKLGFYGISGIKLCGYPSYSYIYFQAVAKIDKYNVYVQITGKPQKLNIEFDAEPKTAPDGHVITDNDIITLISSGKLPERNITEGLSIEKASQVEAFNMVAGVLSFLLFGLHVGYTVNAIEDASLGKTVNYANYFFCDGILSLLGGGSNVMRPLVIRVSPFVPNYRSGRNNFGTNLP